MTLVQVNPSASKSFLRRRCEETEERAEIKPRTCCCSEPVGQPSASAACRSATPAVQAGSISREKQQQQKIKKNKSDRDRWKGSGTLEKRAPRKNALVSSSVRPPLLSLQPFVDHPAPRKRNRRWKKHKQSLLVRYRLRWWWWPKDQKEIRFIHAKPVLRPKEGSFAAGWAFVVAAMKRPLPSLYLLTLWFFVVAAIKRPLPLLYFLTLCLRGGERKKD